MKLVIVESPTKAKTISKYLGKEYHVESSYGHVRDLPKSKLGIDVDDNFAVHYIIPRKVQTRVTALKKAAKKCDTVVLATDADREGEAIAWHLIEALKLDGSGIERIVFHEITPTAITEALEHPRELNTSLVDAQQARRVLDRLVGYKLSPFLWKKISRGLSAGRVQSVALRLVADREAEIQAFKPEEYWTIEITLESDGAEFPAHLTHIADKPVEKLSLRTQESADQIVEHLRRAQYRITEAESKDVRKHAPPPFITSTLQQAAAQRLKTSAKKTMYLAQQLYENGLITYMRTDSVNLSHESVTTAATWLTTNLGADYALPEPRFFKKTSRLAQEAHEAIRPTRPDLAPRAFGGAADDELDKDTARLYDLIWRRFVASQMPSALFSATRINIEAHVDDAQYGLAANGNVLRFDGFLKVWSMTFEEKNLPPLTSAAPASLVHAEGSQHFTEPPPRFNEASLVKILEKHGIGRPSTYAPIISVIQTRNYVEKQQGRFFPTEMGTLVNKVLTENFPEVVDFEFTAKMENELDEIAEGTTAWQKAVHDFYDPFIEHLNHKYEAVSKEDLVPVETTDEVCETCGKPMIIKFGRFGKFMACSGFPECKTTKTLKDPPKSSGIQCPKCLAAEERKDSPGELLERRVRKGRARGKVFWGCSKYPTCNFAVWIDPTKEQPVYDPKAEQEAAEKKPKRATRAKPKKS